MKTIALIGGSSDLGRELARELPYRFINFDLTDNNSKADKFIKIDITKPKTLKIFHSISFDAVIHIAGIHPLIQSKKEDSLMFEVNVSGLFNVLNALTKTSCRNFIYISSSSAKNTKSTYGKSKFLAEQLVKLFCAGQGFNAFALRTRGFTPYYSKAYTNFFDYASWVLGGAVHIKDVVQCIDLCLKTPQKGYNQFLVDGKNDFTPEELARWGKEMLMAKYPEGKDLISELTIPPHPEYTTPSNPVGYKPQYGAGYIFEEYKKIKEE